MFTRALMVLLVLGVYVINAASIRQRRQTFYYPEELRKYARPHAGTKFYQGTLGRYAPEEWPSWYTRAIFKWNGDSRIGPYHPNDVRYLDYQRARMRSP